MIALTDIVGQDATVAQLIRMATGPRRPHALILAGPEGVGRRTTAEAMAGMLLCSDPRHAPNAGRVSALPDDFLLPVACGGCPSCRMLASGHHADYHLVTKESARYSASAEVRSRMMQDLGIGVVREFVIAPANSRATMGRGRVFVIRQAELMSSAAQNAMLKTLEEPPPGVTLILLCGSPAELLPTTRSRCALVRFGPLRPDFVAERLAAEGIDPVEARFWAAHTGGSLGRSLRLAEGGLFALKRELVGRLAALTDSADPDLPEWLIAQVDSLTHAATSADKLLARTLATRQSAGVVLAMIASVYRDALAAASEAPRPLIHADQAEQIQQIAAATDTVTIAEIITQLARYEQLLWRNVNPKAVWDNVVITCATGAPLNV